MANELELHDAWKVCHCGFRWVGKTFLKPAPDAQPIATMCARCIAINEKLIRQSGERRSFSSRAEPTADQDQPYNNSRLTKRAH